MKRPMRELPNPGPKSEEMLRRAGIAAMAQLCALLAGALMAFGVAAAEPPAVHIGRFDSASGFPPPPWQVVRFDEKVPATVYRLVRWDGIEAVEASADASMALLTRPVEVDLHATPVLCWRWRVERVVEKANMATRQGDDYAARVYVAFRLPASAMSLAVRATLALARKLRGDSVPDGAINYVWDNRHPVGTQRPNAYTDRTRMIVLRSGDEEAHRWVAERRDVLRDAIDAFGTERARVQLVALAADTDNTGERVTSGFADIHFVARDVECDPIPGHGR